MTAPPSNGRPRLYLIDGYALIYRAFFALISRPLTTSRGENTSAAWGVTNFLLKILEEHKPDYLGMVFDAGMSDRHEIYPEYKATREKMPDELKASLPRVREIVEAFNIPVLELEGYEADDVIGTLAIRAAEENLEAVIVSGDKDFYQMIREHICLLNPGRGGAAAVDEEWVDLSNANERLGVPPNRVVDYLALIGDSSDNVPGVRGIGPKTAVKLIEEYGSLEDILANADQISGKRARESLQSSQEEARLSKTLVTIRCDLPVELDLKALECGPPDRQRLKELFLDLEFHTLVREHGAPEEARQEAVAGEYRTLTDPSEISELAEKIREEGRMALAVQGTHTDPMRGDLVGVAVSVVPEHGFYLPLSHRATEGELLDNREIRNLPALDSAAMAPLVDVLTDPEIEKVGHDLKRAILLFRRLDIELGGVSFDTMVASYLLAPGRREHLLDSLALEHIDFRTKTYEELAGKGKKETPFEELEAERCCDYLAQQTDVALRLRALFQPELDHLHLDELFRTIEMPLVHVLAEMEWNGIRIDEPFFAEFQSRLAADLRDTEAAIYEKAGTEFNINSNPQLREILFERLELPVIKKTKTGPSTDASVLEELASRGYELPTLLLKYRQLDKLQSTYVSALPRLVNRRTGRIHTSFNQAVAATGRLSSSDPNLQNIPIRTDLGAEIRRGFVPADGHLFVAADYSQIELRILAHYSEDPAFVDAFRAGIDIHRQTAALIFGVDSDDVTREMRDRAKTVNFAVIYGIGPFSLGQQLGVSNAEAKEFIDRYFERFPKVRQYLDTQVEFAREHGYVETLTGRRRYIPEIRAKNYNIRSFGERAATNAPIQGTAADLIKIAMIRIDDAIHTEHSGARMLLQVHDELLFESPIDERDATLALVKEHMEGAADLKVPLLVESGVGESWLECK